MDFRKSPRDAELQLTFHRFNASDSAQRADPMRRVTAVAEQVADAAIQHAGTAAASGSGDDYSDRATEHMRSSLPRLNRPEGRGTWPGSQDGRVDISAASNVTSQKASGPRRDGSTSRPPSKRRPNAKRQGRLGVTSQGRDLRSSGPRTRPIGPSTTRPTAFRGSGAPNTGRGALGAQLRTSRLVGQSSKGGTDAATAFATKVTGTPGLNSASSLASRVVAIAVQQGQRIVTAVAAGLASTSAATIALVSAVVIGVLAVVISFLPILGWQSQEASRGLITGTLAAGTSGVPAQLIPLYNKAGSRCAEMPATLLAAQGRQESRFDPDAVSPAGAEGIAQFMPGTWSIYGRDANGDGVANVRDPADAIDAQGRYMCDLAAQMRKLVADGRATGDIQTLALAAYNAGAGAVTQYGGVPPYAETQAYAPAVLAYAQTLGATLDIGDVTGDAAAIITALKAKVGTPYSWGGGGPQGPSIGFGRGAGTAGWDCSSFMQYGVYQGTGGKLLLPRTAAAQGAALPSVPRDAIQPGDLLFWGSSAGSAHHVAMYIGGGQMIEEPYTGLAARIVPVRPSFVAAGRLPLS